MREAPGPIPKTLPDVAAAAASIQKEAVDRPDIRLADMSIGQLMLDLSDGTPAYLTGSNVWLRAIFGRSSGTCMERSGSRCGNVRQGDCLCQERLDYDVVLSSAKSTEAFVERMLRLLNSRMPGTHRYARTSNLFGSTRIAMPDGTPIIDAWHLEPGESISELLMGYPRDYQRAAYYVSHIPTPASLIRLARPAGRSASLRAGSVKRDLRYPGRYPGSEHKARRTRAQEARSAAPTELLDECMVGVIQDTQSEPSGLAFYEEYRVQQTWRS